MYRLGAQLGIAPADIDRCDAFSAWAMLGHHRHPDYWLSDYDLAEPDETDAPSGSGRRVASGRGATPGLQAREASRDLFARRRAAARGEAPPPEAEAPRGGALAVASILSGGRVAGGD